jgi:hypothetical protein
MAKRPICDHRDCDEPATHWGDVGAADGVVVCTPHYTEDVATELILMGGLLDPSQYDED